MKTIREPARDIPVVREVDVAVVGGGTAGVAAGVAAARAGADTLLIERYSCLGGQMTGGYVVMLPGEPWCYDVGIPIFGGIASEIVDRLKGEDAIWYPDGPGALWFDPEIMKWLAIDLMEGAGAKMRLHSWVCNVIMKGPRIEALVVESKGGRHAIKVKSVVDASGDCDVAFFSGAAYETARRNISLEGKAYVSDPEAWHAFFKERGRDFWWSLHEMGVEAGVGSSMYKRCPGILLSDISWPLGCASEGFLDGLDVDDLTMIENESRKYFKKMVDYHRANVPGCRDMVLVESSSQLGVRETRRAVGDHIYTNEEMNGHVKFDDCIGRFGEPDSYFEIPYGSIYSKDVENLWVAGRCISTDHEAQGFVRIIPACILTGEAAGTAAALSTKNGCCPARELDVELLVDELISHGVALRDQVARIP